MSHFEALAHRLVGAALKGNQVAIDQIHKMQKEYFANLAQRIEESKYPPEALRYLTDEELNHLEKIHKKLPDYSLKITGLDQSEPLKELDP